jgi:ATP-binding cassette, subfamily B, multidrug efflux pump
MQKLLKYLKPYSWLILIIFILLFGQAMADLSLPGYMADIVNVGIQQGGIENAVPQAIRSEEFDSVTLFMTNAEKTQVVADYIKLDRQTLSESQYPTYLKTYPKLADGPIYKLNTTDKTEINNLNSIFIKYLPVVAAIERDGLSSLGPGLPTVPAGTDPFTFLAQLPPSQMDAIRNAISTIFAAIPESMLKGYSTAYISGEYKAIGMNVTGIQTHYMFRIGFFMLALTLASVTASVIVGFISARIAAALGRDLRRRLFVRVESFSNTEFDKFSTASLITRSTNDITQIQMLMVMLFRFVFYAPILATGGIIKVLSTDQSMLWIIAAAVGVMLTMMVIMFIVAVPKFKSIQNLVDKLNLITREMLTGLMVIRAFNTQKHEEEKFDVANVDLTRTNLFINRALVLLMPAMMLVMNGVMLLIVWVGAHQVNTGSTNVGNMMAFMQYAMQIIFAFLMISITFVMLPRASVSAGRVSEVLETEPIIRDPSEPLKFNGDMRGVIEFKGVSFRYPGAESEVLKDITFTARPGETTAFIGGTGSGKSTLVNLIPRFYDVTAGRVLVDGIDIKSVSQHDLREKIGYISQKAVLFSGTIASNISYGNESTSDEEIAKYADIAQATDFISANDQGLQTQVSQDGTNFSGGQRQRLAIARVLAKKPEIYIFDDSLSALDFKTDATLRKALKKETSSATVLIVTQRVSTIMGAEQIVVLENGIISGVGTHKDLMENCAVYRELALSQLPKEELE